MTHLEVEGDVDLDGAVEHGPSGDEVAVVGDGEGAQATLSGHSLLQLERFSVPPLEV